MHMNMLTMPEFVVCVCEREREIKVYFLYYLGRQDQGQLTLWELGAAGEDGLLGEQK